MSAEGLEHEQETESPLQSEPPCVRQKKRGQNPREQMCSDVSALTQTCVTTALPLVALSEMTSVSIHALNLLYTCTVGRLGGRT